MNVIHEIFHTFGFDDFPEDHKGIMNYPPEKPNQKDINNVANTSFLPAISINKTLQAVLSTIGIFM